MLTAGLIRNALVILAVASVVAAAAAVIWAIVAYRHNKDARLVGTAIFSVLVAAATGVWTIVTYLHNSQLEYVKDFNTKQLEIVFTTATTVANLVGDPDEKTWNDDIAKFWSLYWGPMILIESKETVEKMIDLGKALNFVSYHDRRKLAACSYAVSSSLRKFIEDKNAHDWQINLERLVSENLSDAANDYSSQKLGPAPKVQAQGDATTPSCLGH